MPRSAEYSDDLLRMAATLYHIDGLGQAEVAKLVRVSQTKISRLLAAAQARGIVRISVDQYQARETQLEHELCSRFGLGQAVVVRVAAHETSEIARQTVGHFGAPAVIELLAGCRVLALGGGRSVADVVQRFRGTEIRRLTVVQAMGSIDSNISPVDALELGRALVKRWGGDFLTLSTPAFAHDRRTRDSFLASDQVRYVWQQMKQADAALVGVGAIESSVYLERSVLTGEQIALIRRQGAVGEICGRFLDANGNECDTPWRDRTISIEFNSLRRIPQVIGVAAGANRAAALAAAIRGKLLKSVLVDTSAAQALLSLRPAARITSRRPLAPGKQRGASGARRPS